MGSRYVGSVEKFRSLEVEKDLKIILSTETSLHLMSACSPRPIGERVEFQVELGRNLEIRVRGLNNNKLPPRPITAPTSQVGEVAVVRTSVSYKCGWGSNNKNLTPSLTLPAGEGTRVAARLAHIPLPQ